MEDKSLKEKNSPSIVENILEMLVTPSSSSRKLIMVLMERRHKGIFSEMFSFFFPDAIFEMGAQGMFLSKALVSTCDSLH